MAWALAAGKLAGVSHGAYNDDVEKLLNEALNNGNFTAANPMPADVALQFVQDLWNGVVTVNTPRTIAFNSVVKARIVPGNRVGLEFLTRSPKQVAELGETYIIRNAGRFNGIFTGGTLWSALTAIDVGIVAALAANSKNFTRGMVALNAGDWLTAEKRLVGEPATTYVVGDQTFTQEIMAAYGGGFGAITKATKFVELFRDTQKAAEAVREQFP
jgi:hypothetical protein